MKSFAIRVLAALGLAVSSYASGEGPVTSVGAPRGVVRSPSSPALVFLYDQTDSPSGANITSQDFEPGFDLFDAQAADDFVVPSGVFWSVEEVFIPGTYTGGPAAAVNLTFYADGGGGPLGVVCDYPLQTPLDGDGAFLFVLANPCALREGTYWLVVQARQDSNPNGQWFWNTRSTQSNFAAQWRNPLNGFATGCVNFTPMQSCVAGSGVDLLFWLAGTPGGVVPPAPTECGTNTAYFENASPVPIGDTSVVTSTIGMLGLTGDIWDVNVLTDILHTFPGDIDMTIQSPAGTVVTLSTDNAGDNDDVFHGTVWDDQASPVGQAPYTSSPHLANDHPYAVGVRASPLAPEEALLAFRGEDPNGTWTLTISDDAGGDVGTLIAWGLEIATLQGSISTSFPSYPTNNISLPIPDLGGVSSAIDASAHHGGPFLCALRATTSITHTFPGDLDMTLTSPMGTSVTLSTDNGGSSVDAFHGTTWDDDVNPGGQVPYLTNDGLVNDTAYVSGAPVANLVPEEALALFIGEDPHGSWTLTISDDAGGDAGTLNSWSLEIVTCTCAHAVADRPLRVDEHASSGASNLNGVFETGETVRVEPSWYNPGVYPFSLKGVLVVFDGPPGPTYTVVDPFSDYATITPGSAVNCNDATGDCYDLQLSGGRPAPHWDARIQEAVGENSLRQAPTATEAVDDWTLHVGESFPDVPPGNLFYAFIENIFHNGVTGGCAAPNYCPADFTLRKQMAVFVLKAREGAFYAPPPATGIFTDVPAADPFAPWIEELYNRGVAAGCGAGPTYCPNGPVLRQQMAIFLLKTLLGSAYTPPAATGIFADVPPGNPFAPWIEDLFNRGFAAGCGGSNFCPTNPTTRGQMAPFLVKAFELRLYGP